MRHFAKGLVLAVATVAIALLLLPAPSEASPRRLSRFQGSRQNLGGRHHRGLSNAELRALQQIQRQNRHDCGLSPSDLLRLRLRGY